MVGLPAVGGGLWGGAGWGGDVGYKVGFNVVYGVGNLGGKVGLNVGNGVGTVVGKIVSGGLLDTGADVIVGNGVGAGDTGLDDEGDSVGTSVVGGVEGVEVGE